MKDFVGVPATLRRLLHGIDLATPLPLPRAVVGTASVVQWHRWRFQYNGQDGHVQMWNGASSGSVYIKELANLVRMAVDDNWTGDIQEITGISRSKSDVDNIPTLKDMVEKNCPEMIVDVSQAGLAKNLSHDEIRIIHQPPQGRSDHFQSYAWVPGRIFLINDGGSHHFAAARYIAAKVRQRVPLSGRLITYRLNRSAVKSLTARYYLFAVDEKYVYGTIAPEGARSLKAKIYLTGLPGPWDEQRQLVILPRDNKRSVRMANELERSGATNFAPVMQAAQQGP
ncbi:MAG: DUF6685 family protein [Janthinobacterium lividum]